MARTTIDPITRIEGHLRVEMEVNDGVVTDAWVSDFASSLSTVGTTRTFMRGDGESVTASGGDYGWAVSSDAAAEAIEEAERMLFSVTQKRVGSSFMKVGDLLSTVFDHELDEFLLVLLHRASFRVGCAARAARRHANRRALEILRCDVGSGDGFGIV